MEFFELKDLWPLADYITIHVPLMDGTHRKTQHKRLLSHEFHSRLDLINSEVFSLCKRGVKLINVARGGIIDEKALVQALDAGQCGGAALDVFEEEPPVDLKLIQHPLVVCTPHLGANTREAQKRVAIELAQQIIDFKRGHSLIGVVNGSAVTSQFGQGNRPILLLTKRLGQIIAASTSTTPTQISLSFNRKSFAMISFFDEIFLYSRHGFQASIRGISYLFFLRVFT